jgi:pilus assembly protein CpaF
VSRPLPDPRAGIVAPVADVDGTVAELVARVSGFGPLQPLLDDPTVEEVWINSPDRVFVARNGRHELTNLMLTDASVAELVERMLKTTGRRVDLSRPFVDAILPQGTGSTSCSKGSVGASRPSTSGRSWSAPRG